MILAIDTSTPTCKTWWVEGAEQQHEQWLADRQLGDGLIGYLRTQLASRGKTWADIQAIVVFRGPGSFTGLRIGLTVMNTIADTNNIAIVGADGEGWLDEGLNRLRSGENDGLVMPLYGREANITKPRK